MLGIINSGRDVVRTERGATPREHAARSTEFAAGAREGHGWAGLDYESRSTMPTSPATVTTDRLRPDAVTEARLSSRASAQRIAAGLSIPCPVCAAKPGEHCWRNGHGFHFERWQRALGVAVRPQARPDVQHQLVDAIGRDEASREARERIHRRRTLQAEDDAGEHDGFLRRQLRSTR
ncbi:zinc finger domain-containing protein [Humibacter sp.]|uniref:zinc finger domain-containing protein n=1 Tax=Humibacter sp. TaxID=1940291 RepID=UPI003F7E57E1